MAKNIENRALQLFLGGVNPSSRATFGLKVQNVIASVSEAIQKLISQSSHKTLAFTLAEVLVVLGIIGVVSALTLPNLNQNTSEKEKVVKLKKVYSELNDAVGRAVVEYGPVSVWLKKSSTDAERNKKYFERITEFLKVSKTCAPNVSGCFSSSTELNSYYKAITADGTAIVFAPWSGCNDTFGIKDYCGVIFVDLDGPTKGVNTEGDDIFRLAGTKTGVDTYLAIDYSEGGKSIVTECFSWRGGCSAWVIHNGNMDYLKADSSGKCPNGKVLNMTTNTSCK